ncbi:MAG: hypothetical protein LUI09_06505 [Prevotellaceae bacterium]|nr:hypothetical protein [Prevotellaceae bacterium]
MASTDKHYHPALEARLRVLLAQRDWQGVTAYVDSLSNSQFRTAGYMLGEALMPSLPDSDFWQLASVLVRHNSKAFLVTMLKSAAARGLDVGSEGFASFCRLLIPNETDTHKALTRLLPLLRSPEEVQRLFAFLGVSDPQRMLRYLLPVATEAASFQLLLTLRFLDHDRGLLLRAVNYVMKRGGDLSFNLASLLKTYFGLDEVKGPFSRSVEPYELSRLAASYKAFCQALNR